MNNTIVLDEMCKAVKILEMGVDILGERVRKKSISSLDYIGLCPFHTENTASFYLKLKWNKYACFGCNIGGSPLSLPLEYFGTESGWRYLEELLEFTKETLSNTIIILKYFTERERGMYSREDIFPKYFEEIEPIHNILSIYPSGQSLREIDSLYKLVLQRRNISNQEIYERIRIFEEKRIESSVREMNFVRPDLTDLNLGD
ncbi:hypothetical protein HYW75_05850 [Candidatus Pacearchaeota archaeon]|nr:hypothetical protein [Candidatus Pacearchaeota archaeon]